MDFAPAHRRREQYIPLAAFCLRHFLADFIICMCEFDFRQAQVTLGRLLTSSHAAIVQGRGKKFISGIVTWITKTSHGPCHFQRHKHGRAEIQRPLAP
jgi:hypothetical protein